MHRLYASSGNMLGGEITINDKEQIHHNRNVLRLKKNEEAVIFDEKGNEYRCALQESSVNKMVFRVVRKENVHHMIGPRITIACAIPKGHFMDNIIDKLTQLGVDRVIPLETERVIVKLDKRKKELRRGRWMKIILSAGIQSQRSVLPVLEPVKGMKELLSASGDFDLKLIPALTGDRRPLKEALGDLKPKDILVIIGPEGDFTPAELDAAKKAGCIPVSLGPSVLRVETAAVSAAAFIRLYYEER